MTAAALAVVLAAAALTAAGTGVVRAYALRREVLDVPNDRSSHTVPTPRGGGFAIAVVALAGLAVLGALGILPARTAVALCGGGLMVAGVGWVDDHGEVRPLARAAVHAAAATWAVTWLGGMPSLRLGPLTAALGVGGSVLAVLGIVWVTNLYNFMDGIDGIAGGQALVAGAFGGALLLAAGEPGPASAAFLLAAAGVGFLAWNWPPAKIFMGDVGSGLLGFLFAALAVASEPAAGPGLVGWVALFGVFVFDATATLARRVLRGEAWYAAHRTHAYQRAVQSGRTHRQVTLAALGLQSALGLAVAWSPAGALLAGGVVLALAYAGVERLQPMPRGPSRPPPPAPGHPSSEPAA